MSLLVSLTGHPILIGGPVRRGGHIKNVSWVRPGQHICNHVAMFNIQLVQQEHWLYCLSGRIMFNVQCSTGFNIQLGSIFNWLDKVTGYKEGCRDVFPFPKPYPPYWEWTHRKKNIIFLGIFLKFYQNYSCNHPTILPGPWPLTLQCCRPP